jgi:hypothetical protein
MTRSTIVKWAITALLAVPAMPLLATTVSTKTAKSLSGPVHTVRKLSTSAKHRRPHHVVKRNTLASGKKFTHPMIGSGKPAIHTTRTAHATVKPRTTASVRITRTTTASRTANATRTAHPTRIARTTPAARLTHTAAAAHSARTPHTAPVPAANVTRTPPMIDGMHA